MRGRGEGRRRLTRHRSVHRHLRGPEADGPRALLKRTAKESGRCRGSVPDRRQEAYAEALEVCEDGRDYPRVGDHGEHTKRCAAARALADVDREHAAQALHPGHGGPGLRPRGLGVLRRRRGRRRGHDEAAMACVGGEQAMKPHQMGSRARHQCGQARHEVQGLEQDMRGAVRNPAAMHIIGRVISLGPRSRIRSILCMAEPSMSSTGGAATMSICTWRSAGSEWSGCRPRGRAWEALSRSWNCLRGARCFGSMIWYGWPSSWPRSRVVSKEMCKRNCAVSVNRIMSVIRSV